MFWSGSDAYRSTMTAVLAPLLYSLGSIGVLLVMAVVFAETGLLAGFFLPGDSVLFLTGALVASHVISLPLWLVAIAVLTAAVIGDQVGFTLGRHFGPRLFSRPDSRFFRSEYADRAARFFERHGGRAVILARFIPVIRTFVPAVAGIAGMPPRRFTAFNLSGGVLWTGSLLLTGFLFGGIPFVAGHIELITIALAGASALPLGVALLRRLRREPPDGPVAPKDQAATPVRPSHRRDAADPKNDQFALVALRSSVNGCVPHPN